MIVASLLKRERGVRLGPIRIRSDNMARKMWRKPEVKVLRAGAAENQTTNKNDAGTGNAKS